MNVGIVTPIYPPATGGGAVYSRQLACMLEGLEVIETVTIITEAGEGRALDTAQIDGKKIIVSHFPWRASKALGRVLKGVLYIRQNFRYFSQVRRCDISNVDVWVVHSSFYNYPGFFSWFVKNVLGKRRHDGRRPGFVLDIRDQLFPGRKLMELRRYDSVIVCADKVMERVSAFVKRDALLKVIPVPLSWDVYEYLKLEQMDVRGESEKVITYIGDIKRSKNVFALVDAVKIVKEIFPNIVLYLAGNVKLKERDRQRMESNEHVRLLGAQRRHYVLRLIDRSTLVVNPSRSEGMPRSCLEAIAIGKPVLVPPGVREFEQTIPEWIIYNGSALGIAEKICWALEQRCMPNYPVTKHFPRSVIDKYLMVLEVATARHLGS